MSKESPIDWMTREMKLDKYPFATGKAKEMFRQCVEQAYAAGMSEALLSVVNEKHKMIEAKEYYEKHY